MNIRTAIQTAINLEKVKNVQLAERLGIKEPSAHELINGNKNLTSKTVISILDAIGWNLIASNDSGKCVIIDGIQTTITDAVKEAMSDSGTTTKELAVCLGVRQATICNSLNRTDNLIVNRAAIMFDETGWHLSIVPKNSNSPFTPITINPETE